MDWNHRCNRTTAATANEFSVSISSALLLKIVLKFHGIHVVSAIIDVNELGKRPSLGNCFSRCDEGVWNGNDHVASLDARCRQRETQCVSSIANANGMTNITETSKRFFKLFNNGTTNETGGAQCALKHRGKFLFKFYVWSNQIKKRNAIRIIHISEKPL